MPNATILIGGTWKCSQNEKDLPVIDPSNGQIYEHISQGTAGDIESGVRAARNALEGGWGKMSACERGRILTRMSDSIHAHREELIAIEARNTGKPLSQARGRS